MAKGKKQKTFLESLYVCMLTQGTRLFTEDRVYTCTFARVKIFLEQDIWFEQNCRSIVVKF